LISFTQREPEAGIRLGLFLFACHLDQSKSQSRRWLARVLPILIPL
jgi:hypothetical protein